MNPPIVMNPKRSSSSSSSSSGFQVNALTNEEKKYKNVEVLSKEHLDVSLAYDVYNLSKKYIQERGNFIVAWSGGPSVKYLTKLVEPPYVENIEWSKWYFFWVEERTLMPSGSLKEAFHSLGQPFLPSRDLVGEANHSLAYETFLSKVPQEQLNVETIYDPDLPAQERADLYDQKLQALLSQYDTNPEVPLLAHGFPKFDLMVLDMGPNGCVGFLPPDHPVLKDTERWVTVMREKGKLKPPRVTMTLPVVNSASDKMNAVYSALKEDYRKPYRRVPAKLISPGEGEAKWYLDKGAALKMFKPEIHTDKRH